MDTNQPSTSTGINLLSILNKTLDGAKEKMRELENLQEEQTMRTTPQQQSLQEDGKNLKATLIALAKASHHKTFMETCLTRNQPPKNVKPWIEPHIYRSNTTIERKWREFYTTHPSTLCPYLSIILDPSSEKKHSNYEHWKKKWQRKYHTNKTRQKYGQRYATKPKRKPHN